MYSCWELNLCNKRRSTTLNLLSYHCTTWIVSVSAQVMCLGVDSLAKKTCLCFKLAQNSRCLHQIFVKFFLMVRMTFSDIEISLKKRTIPYRGKRVLEKEAFGSILSKIDKKCKIQRIPKK